MKKTKIYSLALVIFSVLLLVICVSAFTSCGGAGNALKYELNPDGCSYTVVGVKSKKVRDIEIPFDYKGYPVTEIADSAFEECTKLESMKIGDAVKRIGYYAFLRCTSMKSLTIGASVENLSNTMEYGAIFGYINDVTLDTVEVSAMNQNYYSVNNCVIERSTKKLVLGTNSSVIPNNGSVDIIGSSAFGGMCTLSEIIIPEGVKTIESIAFADCVAMQGLVLPSTLKSIGEGAFSNCPSLYAIRFNEGLEKISEYAFSGNSFRNVDIPASVTFIGEEAFRGAEHLETVTFADTDGWNRTVTDPHENASYMRQNTAESIYK